LLGSGHNLDDSDDCFGPKLLDEVEYSEDVRELSPELSKSELPSDRNKLGRPRSSLSLLDFPRV